MALPSGAIFVRTATAAVAFGLAAALKWHYSASGAEALLWVLAPTARLAGALLGEPFTFEAGFGYVCLPFGLAIVPACAGVNFMIAAFGSLVWANVDADGSVRQDALLVAASLSAAYVATLCANTVRIVADALLHGSSHHLAGTCVFVTALFVLHAAADRLAGRRSHV